MSTKKTAAKKAARKRTIKKDMDETTTDVVAESAPVQSESTEEAPKKRAPRKTAKKGATDDKPATAEGSEASDRKEPIQGVRDARTQKGDDDAPSAESTAPESKPQADDNQSTEGDQGQQAKGRNRRGRRNRNNKGEAPNNTQQAPAPKIDAKELSKRAWKIFLSEVSEEGLALIGDKEGRELSKRSFRLAEIFLEEQGRRQTPKPQPQQRRRQNTEVVNAAPVEEAKSSEQETPSSEAKPAETTVVKETVESQEQE